MCEKLKLSRDPEKLRWALDWYEVALAFNKYQRRGFYAFSIQL